MENSLNLQQEWQNMSTEMLSKQQNTHHMAIRLDLQSHGLLQNLLFKLKWKLRWIRIIDIPLLIIAFMTRGDLQLLLLALFIVHEIFRALAINQFNKIKTGLDYDVNTKQLLMSNLKAIKSILRIENIFGYLFLPLAGPIGLLAYKLYKYHHFKDITIQANFLWQFGILLIIGLLAIYITKKMNNSLFAVPIKDLHTKIDQLSA